jgi:hypothetical protein
MTELHFQQLEQRIGPYRLGRHVLHDPRSVEYDVRTITRPRPLVTTIHESLVEPWDQGDIGSCTANAALGCLMTKPFHNGSWAFTEVDAQALYRAETRIDDTQIPGSWEPDDTGSTGLWSMKALKAAGYIASYRHAFAFSTVLHALLDGPVSAGLSWYQSMFDVDNNNTIKVDPRSQIVGGHQIALVGLDMQRNAVRVRNSWGTSWADGGYAWLTFDDLQDLLHDSGDITIPVVKR